MKATLMILAVTVMKTGVCIAGVRTDAPRRWVRPVREFGSVLLGDITYPTPPAGHVGKPRVMRPFDLVEFALERPRPDPPHVEDWTCDFVRTRPHLAGRVPEADRRALLEAAACDPSALWECGERSLGALAVDDLSATFQRDTYTGKYEARLGFAGLPEDAATAACTDLKWRALGRRLLADHPANAEVQTLSLGGRELRASLSIEQIWLALGLTRTYNGRAWPLVVGVHTLPDYEADIDYRSL